MRSSWGWSKFPPTNHVFTEHCVCTLFQRRSQNIWCSFLIETMWGRYIVLQFVFMLLQVDLKSMSADFRRILHGNFCPDGGDQRTALCHQEIFVYTQSPFWRKKYLSRWVEWHQWIQQRGKCSIRLGFNLESGESTCTVKQSMKESFPLILHCASSQWCQLRLVERSVALPGILASPLFFFFFRRLLHKLSCESGVCFTEWDVLNQ